jgi:hypothetical protein
MHGNFNKEIGRFPVLCGLETWNGELIWLKPRVQSCNQEQNNTKMEILNVS